MLDEAFDLFAPKEELTPVEFNAKYTYISSEISSYSGYFNPSFNSYICEPLNSFNDPEINSLVIQWGSQLGKSFLLSLGMLYKIWKGNNILYVMPSDQQAKQITRERIIPLMKGNKLIKDLFPADDDLVTLSNIKLQNCNLHFNGASVSKLANFSAPVVLGDEVMKWDTRNNREASAVELAKQRTKSFSKSEQLFVLCSTPSIEDDHISNICYHFKRSDQRYFYVKCPDCGHFAKINFEENGEDFFVSFDNAKHSNGERDMNKATSSARLVCPNCKAQFDNNEKNQIVNHPESHWRASNELADSQIRGYHLNSLYSHYVTLGDAVKTFLESKSSISSLQNFRNGFEGKPWKNRVIQAPDALSLKSLEGELSRGELPKNSAFNLLIADVQKYEFYFMAISVCSSGFIWVCQHGIATGFEMLKSLKEEYNCQYALVDSRYQTSEIITKIAELGNEWIAVRAFDKLAGNAFHDVVLVDSVSGQKAKGGGFGKVREFRINLQHYKTLFFRMRNQELPNLIIYKDMDYELAQHLLGEVQVEKLERNGKTKIVFEAIRDRVDYLDCLVYGISFSYFLRGTKAYKQLEPLNNSEQGDRKTLKDRIRKLEI